MLVALAPLLLPAAVAPLIRRLADTLPPHRAAALIVAGAAALAACSTAALGLFVAAGLLRTPPVPALADLRPALLHAHAPQAIPVAISAAVILLAAATATARTALRHRVDLADTRRAIASFPTTGDLAVVPDDAPHAYALPGTPGRVVVTTAMLRALTPPERDVLLAHERAHLAWHHHRWITALDLLACLHPGLRPLRAALSYHLERWADENAAATVGDRRLAGRAIGRAALAATATGHTPRPSRSRLAATTGPVPRRVAALLAPPPRPSTRTRASRIGAWALVLALAASAASTAEAATDLHEDVHAGHPTPAAK